MEYLLFFTLISSTIYWTNGQACQDLASSCRTYSTVYCQSNTFMKTNCKKTCGFCPTSCKDFQPSRTCQVWKQWGHCRIASVSYGYMNKNCAVTCAFCKTTINTACINKNGHCKYWKKIGHCYSYHYSKYMRTNCRLACGFCSKVITTTTPAKKTTKLPPPGKKTTQLPPPGKKTTQLPPPGKKTTQLPTTVKKTTQLPPPGEKTTQLPPPGKKTTQLPPPGEKTTQLPPPGKKTTQLPTTVKKTTKAPLPETETTLPPTPKKITTTQAPTATPEPIFPTNCGVNKRIKIGSFIVNGMVAQANVWPWQIGLYYYGDLLCGGTLISKQFVVTAAHCVKHRDANGMTVRLGDHKRDTTENTEQERDLIGYLAHPDYEALTYDNDIALLYLTSPVEINKNVDVACLPPQSNDISMITEKCYLSGWGRTEAKTREDTTSNVLQEAKLPIIVGSKCGERNKNKLGHSQITENMFCAGKNDTNTTGCLGDSGGPFVCLSKEGKWVLQGVTSWGSNTCDNQHKYTALTKIDNFVKWIKDSIFEVLRRA